MRTLGCMSSEFKNGYEIRSERNPYNFGAIDRSRRRPRGRDVHGGIRASALPVGAIRSP